jgi:hypothetical protein
MECIEVKKSLNKICEKVEKIQGYIRFCQSNHRYNIAKQITIINFDQIIERQKNLLFRDCQSCI